MCCCEYFLRVVSLFQIDGAPQMTFPVGVIGSEMSSSLNVLHSETMDSNGKRALLRKNVRRTTSSRNGFVILTTPICPFPKKVRDDQNGITNEQNTSPHSQKQTCMQQSTLKSEQNLTTIYSSCVHRRGSVLITSSSLHSI